MKSTLRALRRYGAFKFNEDVFGLLSLKEENFGQPNFNLCEAIMKLDISENHLQYLTVLCYAKKKIVIELFLKKHMNNTGYSDSEFNERCLKKYMI
ncbi:hypothetical protein QYM36_016934 [Artemia franciscana]|uniref:Uncharacterized protein n=1 Tax=Artemia franciscana TaxID=6661 RepID=A0AA88H979_ARTSF|nr:hypothetical protein QYM36_016934 [Artemia franciscana]